MKNERDLDLPFFSAFFKRNFNEFRKSNEWRQGMGAAREGVR
jgi:hypothetical protein